MHTRNVLRKPLATYGLPLLATVSEWIPYHSNQDICVVSGMNVHVLCHRLAKNSSVRKNIDVEVRHRSRVVGRVRDIGMSLQREGRW